MHTSKKTNGIDSLRIVNTCNQAPAKLEPSSNGTLYCHLCSKNVYDLSKYSKWQAKILYFKNRGRMCCKITRSPKGSIIFKKSNFDFGLSYILRSFALSALMLVVAFKERRADAESRIHQVQSDSIPEINNNSENVISNIAIEAAIPQLKVDLNDDIIYGDSRITSSFDRALTLIEGYLGALIMFLFWLFSGILSFFAIKNSKKQILIYALASALASSSIFTLRLFINNFFSASGFEVSGYFHTHYILSLLIIISPFLIGFVLLKLKSFRRS